MSQWSARLPDIIGNIVVIDEVMNRAVFGDIIMDADLVAGITAGQGVDIAFEASIAGMHDHALDLTRGRTLVRLIRSRPCRFSQIRLLGLRCGCRFLGLSSRCWWRC